MKRVIFFLLSGVMVLSAQDLLERARTALDAGFPKVALLKMEETIPMVGKPPAGDEARAALTLPAWPESAAASWFLQRVHGVSAALLAHIAELAFGTELGPSTDGGGG